MNNENANLWVSTDLDGTLLDHYSYSWEAAIPSLCALHAVGAPVIINTSKTFAEVASLQAAIVDSLDTEPPVNDIASPSLRLTLSEDTHIHTIDAPSSSAPKPMPFIVENGSAIYQPDGQGGFHRTVCGCEKADIIAFLHQLRHEQQWDFSGYSDWSVNDIIQHTGLSHSQAEESQAREFSEPLLWHDSDDNFTLFTQAIANSPFRMIRGGRFIHILGQSDKGSALQQLVATTRTPTDSQHTPPSSAITSYTDVSATAKPTLICLGDSHNDSDMLAVADIPVWIRSPVHDFPPHIGHQTPIYTHLYGPEGWHEAIMQILNHQENS